MPSGSYLSGIVSGFQGRKDELEQRRWAEEQQNNQRESKIYEALLQSSDPEIQSLAFTGLLDSANPKRKKGLQGWMGEMQKNPALEGIKRLVQTPVTETKQVQAGPAAVTGYLPGAPSATGSAVQTTNSPTVPRGTPPTPLQPLPSRSTLPSDESSPRFSMETGVAAAAPAGPQLAPGPTDLGQPVGDPRIGTPQMASVTSSHPRQVFRTPQQTAMEQATGHAQGAVAGEVAGLVGAGASPAEAQAAVLLKMRRQAGLGSSVPMQAVPGEYLDPASGKYIQTYATFNRATGGYTKLDGTPVPPTFRRTATGQGNTSRSDSGRISEAIAQRDYGMSLSQLTQENPDALIEVASAAEQFKQTAAGSMTAAREGAKNEATLDKPVDLKTAQATGAPVGAKQKEFVGQQVPTQASMENERQLKNARSQLDTIGPLLDVLPSQHELIGGKAPGAVLAFRRRSEPTRSQVAALESAIQNIAAPLQRAKGDTKLSNADMDRAFEQIALIKAGLTDPFGGDTKESALARIEQTKQFLDLSEQNRLKRPTPGGAAAGAGSPPPKGKAGASSGPGQEWQMINGQLYHNGQPF